MSFDLTFIGSLIALVYIFLFAYLLMRIIEKDDEHKALLKSAILSFSILLSIYVIDLVGAIKHHLLTDEERKSVLDMIKSILLLIFAFYFGSQVRRKDKDL